MNPKIYIIAVVLVAVGAIVFASNMDKPKENVVLLDDMDIYSLEKAAILTYGNVIIISDVEGDGLW